MKSLVVIPTFNEKENIASIIEAVLGYEGFEVLVVDDGSPDGTAEIVKSLMYQSGDKIHLIEREGKLGLGTAYIRGFQFGLEKGYDFICEMDADFSHNPADLLRLRAACLDGGDVAIGSRYVKGGGLQNWPKNRILISRGGAFYVQCLTWMPVNDPTAGFICYKSEVLKAINLDKIQFTGYAFQIEMKYVAWKLGFKIVEVPIIFKDRELGKSKMNSTIITEAIRGVLKLRFRNIRRFYGQG